MYTKLVSGLILVAGLATAQTYPRRAVMVGGGDRNRGECTVEVVVDGAAQVEVRGGTALLRNLSGRPPQWRRFECTAIMPDNPADFRFSGVDGRGRQQLIADPRNGGAAVVRIEDSDNGEEGYTFRLTWNGYGSGPAYGPGPESYRGGYNEPYYRDSDEYHRGRDAGFRGNAWRGRFFQQVREDLDHASLNTAPFGRDQARLARTQRELDELQQKLARGFYDERELDEVMGALRAVVDSNRLRDADRDILLDDLRRMREFRLRHDEFGAR